jgi:hypothetical protein
MRATFRRDFLLVLSCTFASLAIADLGAAATFSVTSLADAGPGSLRSAVLAANTVAGADEIVFAPGLNGTITLTSGEIAITDDLVITGPGADVLTVSGNRQSRIFNIDAGTDEALDVTVSRLTLTQGFAQGPGGAVLVKAGRVTIRHSVISDSVSESSLPSPSFPSACGGNLGGFDPTSGLSGAFYIEDSTVSGGVAKAAGAVPYSQGGNICSGGVFMERSTVSGGWADSAGGIFGGGVIRASTISGNLRGAGLYGTWRLEASTISGNIGGGAVLRIEGGTLNSTISGNTYFGIYVTGNPHDPASLIHFRLTTFLNNGERNLVVDENSAYAFLDHSILAGTPQDVPFLNVEANYSLIENPPGEVLGTNNILGVDPLLTPLGNHGGPTLTHALLPGSPAIEAGDPAIPDPPATDQRGFARIVGPRIDLGAVEAQQQGIAEVPVLSPVGLLALMALLSVFGVWRLRSRRCGRAL